MLDAVAVIDALGPIYLRELNKDTGSAQPRRQEQHKGSTSMKERQLFELSPSRRATAIRRVTNVGVRLWSGSVGLLAARS